MFSSVRQVADHQHFAVENWDQVEARLLQVKEIESDKVANFLSSLLNSPFSVFRSRTHD